MNMNKTKHTSRILDRFLIRRSSAALLVLGLLVALAPSSNAQQLDGLWFKVTASVKGGGANPGGDLFNIKGKVVAYMFVAAIDPEPEGGLASTPYTGAIFSEVTPGNWQQASGTSFVTLGADEEGMVGPTLGADDDGIDLPMALTDDSGGEGITEFIRVTFIARAKIKTDKEGAVKNASFKSFGAVVPEGSSDGELLFGGAKVSGKSIDPSKLPFTPPT